MLNLFTEEHRQLLSALIKNKVDFMLVGGYAVIHYGYDRSTGDMDIWLKTGNDNRDKLTEALKDFGITEENIATLKEMDFNNPVPVFYFGKEPRRIDFVTMISNITFKQAMVHVNYIDLEDIKVPVIDYDDLLFSKSSSTRLKDRADIEELKKINKYRNQ